MSPRAVVLVAALAAAAPASADAPDAPAMPAREAPRTKPVVGPARRTLAVLAAIGPGFIVRGAGSWLVHERRAAKQLLIASAVGFAGALVGTAPIGLTRGHPYSIPALPVLLLGGGLFTTAWWADIAVAAGVDRLDRRPLAAPPWSLELGTVWLRDPFRDRGLARAAARVELGRVGLGGVALLDAEGRSRDAELDVRVRIAGAAATGAPIAEGSRIWARAVGRLHDDDDDRVTLATGELELGGRLDLEHIDGALRGSFAELSTGVAVERATYAMAHETSPLVLGTFAWGVYLGGRGEAAVFYDHRRDSLAGGIAAYRAAGFVGSLGATAEVVLTPRWAVRGQLEYGNAWVTTLAVRYRGGVR